MKTAFVYFSLTGNLSFVARRVEEALGADVIRLEPVNAYPASGARKFLMGGKSAVFGEAPKLKPNVFDASAYDLIILGTPVWAGTFAPPLRTFIRDNKAALAGKRLAAVICSSGGSADKALGKLAEELGGASFAGTLALVDPMRRPTPDNDRQINEFCAALKRTE